MPARPRLPFPLLQQAVLDKDYKVSIMQKNAYLLRDAPAGPAHAARCASPPCRDRFAAVSGGRRREDAGAKFRTPPYRP
jgi:hypothetical protein